MTVTAGTMLGPYHVLATLGEGGMGTVYMARDTRLDRTVAIKVLPPDRTVDGTARARFDREARAIAALSHPHICAVYDVGQHVESTTTQALHYLVMEHLEGETLADRLTRAQGPLPLADVLSIGIAITDALNTAHRAGIVHRDVKPANIILTKSGPKLLDFGLAKWRGPNAATLAAGSAGATTAARLETAQGTLLGTIHYMAPEQVEGREADARSDLWAIGAVLYEMATGQRPFDGASVASVIGAILKDTPTPVSKRTPVVPAALDHVIERCLDKDPEERWQDAGDVCRELKWIARRALEADAQPATAAGATPSGRISTWRTVALVGAGAVVAAAVTLAIQRMTHVSPIQLPETRVDIVTTNTDDPTSFALAPNGRALVFVGTQDGIPHLWLRELHSASSRVLPGTEGASHPFWSPDSQSVAFFAGRGQLKRSDLASGVPHVLTSASLGRGGTWNADGVILYSAGVNSPLFKVPATGGAPTAATSLGERQAGHRFPTFLPDGRHFLFYATGAVDRSGIYIGSLDSTDVTLLTNADSAGTFLAPGWLLWVRAGALQAQRLDIQRRALTGDAQILAAAVTVDGVARAPALSASSTGLIAYRAGTKSRRQLQWFDRGGRMLGTFSAPDENVLSYPNLSPDGRRVAASRVVEGNEDVWLIDGDRQTRFTFDPGADRFPVWSPRGDQILFDSIRTGQRQLYLKPVSGTEPERVLVESTAQKVANDWSPDGRFIVYYSVDQETKRDLWVRPMTGDTTPRPLVQSVFEERGARFSPDGRFVAYMSNESGRDEVYVRAFDATKPGAPAAQWQLSSTGGMYPAWRADGRELYYVGPAGDIMAVPIAVTGTAFEPGTPVALFQSRIYGGGVDLAQGREFDVSRDGRFLINIALDQAPAPITLIQNWRPAELGP